MSRQFIPIHRSRHNPRFNQARRRFFTISLLILTLVSNLLTPLSQPALLASSAPTPLSPGEGAAITATGSGGSIASPPVAIPSFSWSPLSGATSYRLQLSQDIAFTTRLEFTTPNTTYTPTSAAQLSDGLWYWRVRVDGPTASDYSPIRSFTKTWASDDNFPSLNSPADGATLEFLDPPAFSWQAVVGAAQYRFQIASGADFNALLYNQLTLATTHQPPAKLSNGAYFWRVIPIDPANREGTYSPTRSFNLGYNQVPQLLSPANNSLPTFTPSFRWSAVRGAQFYRLQYSTDPSFNTNTTSVDSKNTTYTPTPAMPNDVNFYWRVRAHSGNSISDWSGVWQFKKQWYIQPVLLTPTNLYQFLRFPLFSWTPVPGASYYKFEMNTSNSFPGPTSENTSNTFYTPKTYNGDQGVRYWRVTPYDRNNNAGKPSEVFSYVSSQDFSAPALAYPLYYYPPNTFPHPDEAVAMLPYEDRTAALPIFIWQRLTSPYPMGGDFSPAYRIQVSRDPLFLSLDWSADTENLSAAPTQANPFNPIPNADYFWRVCPLSGIGGDCLEDSGSGQPWWSQVWKAHFDPALGRTPTGGSAPQLLRPAPASEHTIVGGLPDPPAEFVETTPLLEWWPLQGASSYEIQIADEASFSALVDTNVTINPAYAPTHSIAQRSLGRLAFGSYYWRVRAIKNGVPSSWSAVWQFHIASQSQWLRYRTTGNSNNYLKIATDPASDAASTYDLTGLYASQSADDWFFGFNANAASSDVMYGLYLDRDRRDGSGAASDARSFNVSTISSHRPDYAIYIWRSSTPFSLSPDQVFVYPSSGSGWGTPQTLSSIGGDLFPRTLRTVAIPYSTYALTAGDRGNALEWNGSGWTALYGPVRNTLYSISVDDSVPRRWAVGAGGTILDWNYGLGGWEPVNSPLATQLNAVDVVSQTLSIAVGAGGKILHWNGNSWGNFTSPTTTQLNGVSVIDTEPAVGWAVGDGGAVLRWRYNSVTKRWEWQDYGSYGANLHSVATYSANLALAVGDGGLVLRWNGSTWSPSHPTTNDLYSVAIVSNTNAWAVGELGTILHWDGASWTPFASPTTKTLYSVSMATASSGMAVGERGANLRWNGSAWSVAEDPIGHYVEIMVPNTAIGQQEDGGSYALSLFSSSAASAGQALDSIPSNTSNASLKRFANVTERLSLVLPPNNLTGDPATDPSILPFFWDYPAGYWNFEPVGTYNTAPWAGATMRAYLDPQFTTQAATFDLVSTGAYYGSTMHAWPTDFMGDNSYYWRIRPRYLDSGGAYLGAWSQGWRFERQGFTPQNLLESVSFATPTFSWELVEGAESYDLQVDNDPNFGSTEVNVNTSQTAYTPITTLANGSYYWRVRIHRNGNIVNEWSPSKTFHLVLPAPANLSPNDPQAHSVVGQAPSLCWDPLIIASGGAPVLAAYKYRVQVSKADPTFSVIFDSIDTEQSCWTPVKGYDDGKYYWRVAMIDGQGRLGDYSAAAVFTKQYPITTLVSPLDQVLLTTPTFMWTAVSGAASYKLEVSQSPTFAPIYDAITTNSIQYTPAKTYQNDRTYYWRVAIVDKDGKLGPFTDATILLNPGANSNKVFLPLTLR